MAHPESQNPQSPRAGRIPPPPGAPASSPAPCLPGAPASLPGSAREAEKAGEDAGAPGGRALARDTTASQDVHLAGNELRLMDYLAGQLPVEETQAIAAHLAVCPECRALCDQWQQLEFRLESGLKRPVLSAGFSDRLRQRIQAESAPMAAHPTREQLQAEMEARWAQYRRRFWRAHLPGLLDGLGYGVAAAVGGYFLFHWLVGVLGTSTKVATGSVPQGMVTVALAFGLLVLAGGVGFSAKHQLARWLGEL